MLNSFTRHNLVNNLLPRLSQRHPDVLRVQDYRQNYSRTIFVYSPVQSPTDPRPSRPITTMTSTSQDLAKHIETDSKPSEIEHIIIQVIYLTGYSNSLVKPARLKVAKSKFELIRSEKRKLFA